MSVTCSWYVAVLIRIAAEGAPSEGSVASTSTAKPKSSQSSAPVVSGGRRLLEAGDACEICHYDTDHVRHLTPSATESDFVLFSTPFYSVTSAIVATTLLV